MNRTDGANSAVLFCVYVLLPVSRKRLAAQRRRYEGVYNRIAAASGIACGEEKRARRAGGGVSVFPYVYPPDKNAAARKAEPASTKIATKPTQTTSRARYIPQVRYRTIQVIKNVRRT
jgi:hypothetical protein